MQFNYLLNYLCFQDLAYEEQVNSLTGEVEYTGHIQRRLVLVLDCVVANEFTDKMADLMNLQHYVIREKRLSEKEAVVIFFDIVRIIDSLHRVCRNFMTLAIHCIPLHCSMMMHCFFISQPLKIKCNVFLFVGVNFSPFVFNINKSI